MKRIYLSTLLIVATFTAVFSQVPSTFNYQAVVRNASGEILANKTVSFRISLLKNTETGDVVYSETHSLSTNDFGLVNLKIGGGAKLSGTFSPENWGEVIFTKVEFDPDGGSSFSHLATTKLSSVPFAFMAQTVVNDDVEDADADPANELQTLTRNGSTLTLSNGGGSVTIPSSGGGDGDDWGVQTVKTNATLTGDGTAANPLSVVPDGDGDDSNELQALTKTGNSIELSNGGGSVIDEVEDADADPANEIQTLSIDGTLLELSNGGGSVTLPASGDNWGAQSVNTNASLTGNGTSGSPLSVVADGDGDDTNELQTLSINASNLTLSDGGGTVTLPASPWSETASKVEYIGNKTVSIKEGSGSGLKTKSGSRANPPKLEVSAQERTAISIYNETSLYPGLDVWNEEGSAAYFTSSSSKPVAVFENNDTGLAAEFKNKIKIADGTQGDGKVLTSDTYGIASWQVPAAGGGSSLWTESGSDVYRASGKIGIGTSSPSYIMDIQASSATFGLKGTSSNAVLYLDKKSSASYAYILYRINSSNKYYVGLLGNDTYKINYGGSSGLHGLEVKTSGDVAMSGNLEIDEDVYVNQNLEVADDLTVGSVTISGGDVKTQNTGSANMLPIAYGKVSSGSLYGHTSNVTSVEKSGTGKYKINISGFTAYNTTVITATKMGGNPWVVAQVGSFGSGYIKINVYDIKNDAYIDGAFSFVVYQK